ncbi:MAG: glycosyltransferase [Candidatus Bathyarchaeia archaeon]
MLPCFNEEKNIKPLVYLIDDTLKPHIRYKIIAVNDGSHDRTSEVLKDLSTDYPLEVLTHQTNLGLGAALRTGLCRVVEEAFDDDYVVIMDSDNTHNPKHVLEMLAAAGYADVVVGSRYVKGGRQLNVPLHRVILSKAANLLVRLLFQLPVNDATSGFRCFRAYVLKRTHKILNGRIIQSSGFIASLELLLNILHPGVRMAEVPILLDYGRKRGRSKLRLFSTVVNYLLLFLKRGHLNSSKSFG